MEEEKKKSKKELEEELDEFIKEHKDVKNGVARIYKDGEVVEKRWKSSLKNSKNY